MHRQLARGIADRRVDHSGGADGLAEAGCAVVDRIDVDWATQLGDDPMAELDQMLGSQLGAPVVVLVDKRQPASRNVSNREHERRNSCRKLAEKMLVG